MKRILIYLHLLGFALFLGSIPTYVVLSLVAGETDPARLAAARGFILAGTQAVTIPGLWLAAASGLVLAFQRRHVWPRWIKLKLALVVFIMLNTHFGIAPAIEEAAALAGQAARVGVGDPALALAVARESALGGLNLVLALTVVGLVVRRPRLGEQPLDSAS